MKKCNKCGEVLPLHMFCKDKLKPLSKECKRKYNKVYRDKNKEKINEKNRAYYKENKEELKKKAKVYRDKNKEKLEKKAKVYYEENKEELNERRKTYYKENKEESLEYQRGRVLKLPDSYIRQILNSQGIDASLITPELIELKRAILKVKRIIKEKSCKNSQD